MHTLTDAHLSDLSLELSRFSLRAWVSRGDPIAPFNVVLRVVCDSVVMLSVVSMDDVGAQFELEFDVQVGGGLFGLRMAKFFDALGNRTRFVAAELPRLLESLMTCLVLQEPTVLALDENAAAEWMGLRLPDHRAVPGFLGFHVNAREDEIQKRVSMTLRTMYGVELSLLAVGTSDSGSGTVDLTLRSELSSLPASAILQVPSEDASDILEAFYLHFTALVHQGVVLSDPAAGTRLSKELRRTGLAGESDAAVRWVSPMYVPNPSGGLPIPTYPSISHVVDLKRIYEFEFPSAAATASEAAYVCLDAGRPNYGRVIEVDRSLVQLANAAGANHPYPTFTQETCA